MTQSDRRCKYVLDGAVADAPSAQRADLDHIEPTGVFWRVVECKAAQDAVGVAGRKSLVERAGRMAGQVIEGRPDPLGVGVVDVNEVAHALSEVDGGAPKRILGWSAGPHIGSGPTL